MYIKQQYDKIKLGKKEITLKNNQTIVEDINRVINHIQTNKILATKAKRYFGLKHIKELNDILVNPLNIISTRPAQKTYPNINGLYLILRAMGIIRFKVSKKEIVMQIDEELLKNWQSLNETEQYFMLLELWLIHSNPEGIIEGYARLPLKELNDFFIDNSHSLTRTLESMNYSPEYYNLALFEMFGFVKIKSLKPKEKNRWNIKEIKVKPLIRKILPLIRIKKESIITLIYNPPPLGYYQKLFQPHFQEFKNILKYPKAKEPITGVYRLKISLGRVYHIIEISSDKNFEFLASDILKQFNFDCDHLYEFRFTDNFGNKKSIQHYRMSPDGNNLWVDEYCLKELPLQAFESFKFIFDFGDWWEFDIFIEEIREGESIDEVKLIKSYGTAPKQYPNYEEEWGL